MLEYKRESIEAARKIRQLEEQRRKLEASEHAVEVCWTQVGWTWGDALVGLTYSIAGFCYTGFGRVTRV